MQPWRCVVHAGIGGLTDVGFFADGRYLLVVGFQGRGVYDLEDGERIARDRLDDWSYCDDANSTAAGIGPLEGVRIPLAGLMSDRALPRASGRWQVALNGTGLVLTGGAGEAQEVIEPEEVRVYGFGPGGTLVLATSNSFRVFRP